MDKYPLLVLLFSGKRKCGKDYVTDSLLNRLDSEKTVIIKISAPIKSHWARCNDLSLDELLSAEAMKEQHRRQMVEWSENLRKRDSGVFCREAVQMYKAREKPIWIVSDIRRKTDIAWFREDFGGRIKTIRIIASEESRRKRGWSFTSGIDDAETECDLDDVTEWDLVLNNDGNNSELEEFFKTIQATVNTALKAENA